VHSQLAKISEKMPLSMAKMQKPIWQMPCNSLIKEANILCAKILQQQRLEIRSIEQHISSNYAKILLCNSSWSLFVEHCDRNIAKILI
jgi:hypothetical protein